MTGRLMMQLAVPTRPDASISCPEICKINFILLVVLLATALLRPCFERLLLGRCTLYPLAKRAIVRLSPLPLLDLPNGLVLVVQPKINRSRNQLHGPKRRWTISKMRAYRYRVLMPVPTTLLMASSSSSRICSIGSRWLGRKEGCHGGNGTIRR